MTHLELNKVGQIEGVDDAAFNRVEIKPAEGEKYILMYWREGSEDVSDELFDSMAQITAFLRRNSINLNQISWSS